MPRNSSGGKKDFHQQGLTGEAAEITRPWPMFFRK